MIRILATAIIALSFATPILAQDYTYRVVDETFDDVSFSIESAILDMGLTIDSVSKVGDMLERTRIDVGSDITLFSDAIVYNFCSASISRQVMEADIMNIAFCPYGIFMFSTPGNSEQTTVGHRNMPGESMAPVNAMLDAIIADALDY